MRFKKLLLLAASATIPLLTACNDSGDPATPHEASSAKAPTSRIDPATGEPTAINVPTADRVFTIPTGGDGPEIRPAISYPICEPDALTCEEPTCDPVYDYGCEPCPASNPDAWCYVPPCTITSIIDTYHTVRTGDQYTYTPRWNGVGSTSCGGYLMLIGVGMRMDDNDNITTLHLKFQRVYADGTFGPTELRMYGTLPNHSLEVYGEALPGEAIVGVGVGSQYTHNVQTLRIWKRRPGLTASGVRMTGYTTAESFGYLPGGVLDTSYNTTLDTEVYVGLGARGHDHEVKTLHHHVGHLK